jgi:hypothetical protein
MDLRIIETGNGGDAVFNGIDLEITEGFGNMPYLGFCGGNVEESTREYNTGEQRFDWWGNNLLYPNQSGLQFNSDFERLLNNTSLTSSARVIIEQTLKSDLSFMSDFSSVTIESSIVSVDRIELKIKIIEPTNIESNEFVYIWDSTRNELIVQ